MLWKWLIERLRKSKKEKPPGQHLSVSSPYKDRSVLLPSIKGFSKERLSLLGKVNDHTSYIERAKLFGNRLLGCHSIYLQTAADCGLQDSCRSAEVCVVILFYQTDGAFVIR